MFRVSWVAVSPRWEATALCIGLELIGCEPVPMPGAPTPPSSSPQAVWPSAKLMPLGEARVAYAKYMNDVHSRIHPIFTEFLASLDRLPGSDARNGINLSTELAFVVGGKTGRLDSAKVSRSSGVPEFDAGVLDAMKRAFPGRRPDPSTWSSDGNLYAIWEFHRGPDACGTWNARPFRFAF